MTAEHLSNGEKFAINIRVGSWLPVNPTDGRRDRAVTAYIWWGRGTGRAGGATAMNIDQLFCRRLLERMLLNRAAKFAPAVLRRTGIDRLKFKQIFFSLRIISLPLLFQNRRRNRSRDIKMLVANCTFIISKCYFACYKFTQFNSQGSQKP